MKINARIPKKHGRKFDSQYKSLRRYIEILPTCPACHKKHTLITYWPHKCWKIAFNTHLLHTKDKYNILENIRCNKNESNEYMLHIECIYVRFLQYEATLDKMQKDWIDEPKPKIWI